MFTNLLKIAIRMSKLAIYTMIICQSMLMAMATETDAQHKFLREISVELGTDDEERKLLDLISEIEAKSDFHFAYSKASMRKLDINLPGGSWSMDELMREISEQLHLSIRRVNETISLMPVAASDNLPEIREEFAEQQTISGKVTDLEGEGLPGATILEKGTTNGTITDVDGNFSLQVGDEAVLQVSFVGYQAQEIPVNGRSSINIELADDISSLEEVVVVAYGTQKKETVTGAINSVRTETILSSPVTNVSSSLAGRVPGLTTVQRSGEPGNDQTTLKIRGIGTLSTGAQSDPLILVDGVQRNTIDLIDPNEIESFNILKDASATAVFGVRGANGVILITTKSGKKGPAKVTVSSSAGFQSYTSYPTFTSAYEWATLFNEGTFNQLGPDATLPFSETDLQKIRDQTDPVVYPNTDFKELLIRDFAPQQKYNVNVSGGTDLGSYFVSFGVLSQKGIFKEYDFEGKDFN
ncbi:unnamed protein product, partial [Chrysoparadoxa australica]